MPQTSEERPLTPLMGVALGEHGLKTGVLHAQIRVLITGSHILTSAADITASRRGLRQTPDNESGSPSMHLLAKSTKQADKARNANSSSGKQLVLWRTFPLPVSE